MFLLLFMSLNLQNHTFFHVKNDSEHDYRFNRSHSSSIFFCFFFLCLFLFFFFFFSYFFFLFLFLLLFLFFFSFFHFFFLFSSSYLVSLFSVVATQQYFSFPVPLLPEFRNITISCQKSLEPTMTYSLELTFSPCSVLSIFYFSDTAVYFSTFSGFHKYFYTSKLQK